VKKIIYIRIKEIGNFSLLLPLYW